MYLPASYLAYIGSYRACLDRKSIESQDYEMGALSDIYDLAISVPCLLGAKF